MVVTKWDGFHLTFIDPTMIRITSQREHNEYTSFNIPLKLISKLEKRQVLYDVIASSGS